MPKLTASLLSSLVENAREAKQIDLKEKEISHVEDISHCFNLTRLDLSKNKLGNAESLNGLRHVSSLTWLNLSGNALDDLGDHLSLLTKLTVLNVSHNELKRIPSVIGRLPALRALIANNNNLAALDVVEACPRTLQTLIISNNSLSSMDFSALLRRCHDLTKLNISHNRFFGLTFREDDALTSQLSELRANHNRISTITHLPPALTILDLGNNPLSRETVTTTSSYLTLIQNINIRGTLLTTDEEFADVRKLFPKCIVFNGNRVLPKRSGSNRADLAEIKTKARLQVKDIVSETDSSKGRDRKRPRKSPK